MATVGTTIFIEDGPRNFIQLQNNEQYLRRFNFKPNQWTNAAIAVLYSIPATTNFTGGLWVGLTTSANAGFGMKQGQRASVQRAIGGGTCVWGSIFGFGNDFAHHYNQDLPSGSYFSFVSSYVGSWSGGVQQGATGGSVNAYVPTTESIQRKGMAILSLVRTNSTTITAKLCLASVYSSSNGTNHNYTDNTLLSAIGETSQPIDGYIPTQFGGISLTNVDDINFPLDTINLVWSGSVPCRIYQVAFRIQK